MNTMTKLRHIALILATTMLALVGFDIAASTSSGPTLTETGGDVTWTGGPFSIPVSPLFGVTNGCLSGQDPTCDYFTLTVDAPYGKTINVSIASSRAADDLDLYVLDGFGNELAQSRRPSGVESVVFAHRGGVVQYTVAAAPWKAEIDSIYTGAARIAALNPNSNSECSEYVPEGVSVRDSTDHGNNMDINVLVLMHGARSQAQASSIFTEAQRAYSPLGISLKPTYQIAPNSYFGGVYSYGWVEGAFLIQASKSYLRGLPPEGIDLVYLLTEYDIFHNGYVRGLADCIGGIANPTHAFAAGQIFSNPDGSPNVLRSSHIAAHEIGHLLGGQHHYSDCAEGGDVVQNPPIGGCTVMTHPYLSRSLNFSLVNGAIVRDHAVRYGRGGGGI